MTSTRAALAGVVLLLAGFAFNARAAEIHSFTNRNLAIPDGSLLGLSDSYSTTSSIARIDRLRVRLHVEGEFNGDLYGYLRHAQGGTTNFCVLLNRPGKTVANPAGYADTAFDVVFDDAATNGDFHIYRTVTDPLSFTTDTLPKARADAPYEARLLANGGVASYTWELVAGSFPAGLTLDPDNGDITGTPTTAGAFHFTARASDSGSPVQSATRSLNIVVLAPATATLGNTNDGAMSDFMGASWLHAGRFQATADQRVARIFAKVGATAGNYRCAVYSDNSSSPDRLLGSSPEVASPNTGWQSFPLNQSVTVTNGQYYWLAIWSDSGSAQIFYSGMGGTTAWGFYNYGNWPNQLPGINAGASLNYCIYAMDAPPTLTAIAVSPPDSMLLVGGSQQFTAAGIYSDGTAQNLTSVAAWESSNTTVATISPDGQVAAATVGSTTVSATFAGHGGNTTVTVESGISDSAIAGEWQPDGRNEQPTEVTELTLRSTTLGSFVGADANGDWTLLLVDAHSGGTNVLQDWGLEITGATAPQISWHTPPDIVYGTPLSVPQSQLNATASVPGTFTYDPPPGTVLSAGGGQTISMTFTPFDTTNYAAVTTNVTVNVLKKALTITANSLNKVYGASPALSATCDGLVNGDTPASLDTLVTLASTATAASPVGSYVITASGAADSNYSITFVPGTLIVTRAPLTITAENKLKLYGAALPVLSATYHGLVNGDTPATLDAPASLSTVATASSGAGFYAITVMGAADSNYAITAVTGTMIVIPAPLIITAVNKSKVYGASLPSLTATYNGFVNGDTPANLDSPLILTTTGTAGGAVGAYPITPGGAADANYAVSFVPGMLTVTPAALTITAANKSKSYGAALPEFTASYAGWVNGDAASSLDTSVNLGTTASASSPLGTYPITASGAADANYSITFVPGVLTIGPAPLTITAENKFKAYGGAMPLLTVTYSGLVNGETPGNLDIPVSLSTTANEASPTGSYSITASGAADANYTITHVNGTLTVNPAPLIIRAADQTKVYGQPIPTLTATYSGFVNGDSPARLDSPAVLNSAANAGSAAGNYPITPSGAVDANYSMTYVPGTISVTPALLTITPENKTKSYGDPLPILSASYNGLVNGDTPASLDTPAAITTTATAASPVGAYAITASGATDANYTIAFGNGALTVTPALLTITAEDQSKVYGAALPALTATYNGFVNGEGPGNLDTPPILATGATTDSNAGTYPITVSGAADANYSILYSNGVLNITRAVSLGALTSSANPQLPGVTLSFTFSASVATPGSGTPNGPVRFLVNGVFQGQVNLSEGRANVFFLGGLPLGTHTITAQFVGGANFLGVTNTLLQVVNTPPLPGPDTIQRWPTAGAKVAVATLLANDSDVDGDSVILSSISSTSSQGGSLTLSNGWIHYLPPAGFTNLDSFAYTISDGRGAAVVVSVTITINESLPPPPNLAIQALGNGSYRLQVDAITGINCAIEYTENPASPNWQPLCDGAATASGVFEWMDTPPSGAAQRYYRSSYPQP